MTSWLDDARSIPCIDVAQSLGLVVNGLTFGPCPTCRLETRSSRNRGERRLPCAVVNVTGWDCRRQACEGKGDAIALASMVLTGQKKPDQEGWRKVKEHYTRQGWVADADGLKRPDSAYSERPKVSDAAQERWSALTDQMSILERLPIAAVDRLFAVSEPVTSEPRASRWLASRGAGWGWPDAAERVARLELARALPESVEVPPAFGFKRAGGWQKNGWAIVLPCFDFSGSRVAARARWTGARKEPPFAGKEVSPSGEGFTRGTVYACHIGRQLLKLGADAMPQWWDGQVAIVEGGAAFLCYASEPSRPNTAVFGVWTGAWPDSPVGDALASRIKGADLVVLARDNDDGGGTMMQAIKRTCERADIPAAVLLPSEGGSQ